MINREILDQLRELNQTLEQISDNLAILNWQLEQRYKLILNDHLKTTKKKTSKQDYGPLEMD